MSEELAAAVDADLSADEETLEDAAELRDEVRSLDVDVTARFDAWRESANESVDRPLTTEPSGHLRQIGSPTDRVLLECVDEDWTSCDQWVELFKYAEASKGSFLPAAVRWREFDYRDPDASDAR